MNPRTDLISGPQPAPGCLAPGPAEQGLGAGFLGLSVFSTSQTKNDVITVSPYKSRMRRLRTGLLSAAALVEESLQDRGVRYRAALAHLTYAPGVGYDPKQISRALDALRKWAKRRGIWVHWVWRMEFGERSGRLHYHVMVWLPRGVTMPKWDVQGWWPHGSTRMEWARRPIGYLAKYASKAPVTPAAEYDTKGARWWGGAYPLAVRLALRLRLAPGWVQGIARAMDATCRRLAHGWWRIGAFEFQSPWEFLGLDPGGGVRCAWRGWDQFNYEVMSDAY